MAVLLTCAVLGGIGLLWYVYSQLWALCAALAPDLADIRATLGAESLQAPGLVDTDVPLEAVLGEDAPTPSAEEGDTLVSFPMEPIWPDQYYAQLQMHDEEGA